MLTLEQLKQKYELVIGLEVHVELKTKSGMFCECKNEHFGVPANTNVCPVCLGLPGALPVPNETALEWTILFANALNCKINKYQQFDRKHYSYPDLPKGYQITQFYFPAGEHGYIEINGKKYRIHRLHLEEDTGKSQHKGKITLLDFNRSGVPLVEIVSEPDFKTAQEAKEYLKQLHLIVRYLDISDADLEKGSMRLEPNISVRKKGETKLPDYKVEVKNINSFNFVVKAIEYEFVRQAKLLEQGITPDQETRGFNPATGKTVSQRKKEIATDYRYLPDPDIPPIRFTQKQIDAIVAKQPELPLERLHRFIEKLDLREDSAKFLVQNKLLGDLFEEQLQKNKDLDAKKFAIFLLNKSGVTVLKDLTQAVKEFKAFLTKDTIDTKAIKDIVAQVIQKNPKAVADYKKGKTNAIQFLLGQFMRTVKKRIDVNPVITEIKAQLEE